MGQRHQIFLIARIRPHRKPPGHPGYYRCVAAFHDQWCYGSIPLKAIRRFITLVSQPENASVVRAELQAIQGKYGRYMDKEPRIPKVPCPFTTSLLGVAWTTDLDPENDLLVGGISLGGDVLWASMDCWDYENDDGITVIDISKPETPSYCFLTENTPLNARGYLQKYYPKDVESLSDQIIGPMRVRVDDTASEKKDEDEDEDEEDDDDDRVSKGEGFRKLLLKSMNDLADIPILSAHSLREAWPYEAFEVCPYTTASKSPLASALQRSPLSTLTDVALDVAVKHMTLDNDDTTELEELVWLPGKAERIITTLRGLQPFADNALPLLVVALLQTLERDKTTRVDLSGFQMSGHQILKILPSLPEGVECLDVSYNTVIVTDDIPDIVASSPTSLRRLVLMGCSAVEDERLVELVCEEPSRFKMLEGIIHPAFLTINKPSPYPHSFVFAVPQPGITLWDKYISIPFFTPNQIVHALLDILPSLDAPQDRVKKIFTYSGIRVPMLAISAFNGGPRKPEQKFGERIVVNVPAGLPCLSCDQPEIWAFCLETRDPSNVYAFVHYKEDELFEESDSDASEAQDRSKKHKPIGRYTIPGYTSKAYDLQGFLKCMAEEGRPMPSDDLVTELQGRLSAVFSGGILVLEPEA